MKATLWRLALAAVATVAIPASGALAQVVAEAAPEPLAPVAGDAFAVPVATQVIRLSPDGIFHGQLARLGDGGQLRTIPNLDVTLIQGAQVVTRVATDADGEFAFSQLAPGHYTILASNPKDLLVLPIWLVPPDGTDAPPALFVAASPVRPSSRDAMLAGILAGPAAAPAGIRPANNAPAPPAEGTYEVALGLGGTLAGRLDMGGANAQVDYSGMMVRVMRAGEIEGESPVGPNGEFAISGVTVGPVSLIAFGPLGFSAVGVEVVADGGVAVNALGETFVAVQDQVPLTLNLYVAPMDDVVAGSMIEGDSFTVPTAGPGFGAPGFGAPGFGAPGFGGPGGGFGGGGGGLAGGGGGLGAIGALGALGAAAAIIASDDDNDDRIIQPPPASGAMP